MEALLTIIAQVNQLSIVALMLLFYFAFEAEQKKSAKSEQNV